MKTKLFLTLFVFVGIEKQSHAQIITTIAGSGAIGYGYGSYSGDGGQATVADLNYPYGITLDRAGNIYIADAKNNRIRKINTAGIITSIAGNGFPAFTGDSGQATASGLYEPIQTLFDPIGNMYITDWGNNRIRKVNTAGIITTIAGNGMTGFAGDGGQATAAKIYHPNEIAFDAAGNLYIADTYNQRIRKVSTLGIITTIAGNGYTGGTGYGGYSGDGGPATAAEFNSPDGITFDAIGNLYIADAYNNRIRMINTIGIINTVVGIGTAGFSGDGGASNRSRIK